jgi:hypothetical protein
MTSVANRLPLSQAYHLHPDEADTMRPGVVTSHELPPDADVIAFPVLRDPEEKP